MTAGVEPHTLRYVAKLLERRRLVVDLIRQWIAEDGEEAVLFTGLLGRGADK